MTHKRFNKEEFCEVFFKKLKSFLNYVKIPNFKRRLASLEGDLCDLKLIIAGTYQISLIDEAFRHKFIFWCLLQKSFFNVGITSLLNS